MSPERRYREDEIASIFEQAARDRPASQRELSPGNGLTLTELQQIGSEVGIAPESIARAAGAVDRTGQALPVTTYLGLPVGVARTVELPGAMSDEQWDRLVVDLRETFGARGRISRDGSLREWRNGNLYALVEPTESGHRLRLRTRKGNAQSTFVLGFAAFLMMLVLLLIPAFAGDLVFDADAMMLALFGAVGLGSTGIAAYRLSGWAEERGRQMEAIAARAAERANALPARMLREPGESSA